MLARAPLWLLLLAIPLAAADSFTSADPPRDETTGSTFRVAETSGLRCHEPSVDSVELSMSRDAQTTTFTWRMLGPLGAPVMTCNDQAMPMNVRGFAVAFMAQHSFFWTASGTDASPTPSCVKASHPYYGNTPCLSATITPLADGWQWSVPTSGTLVFPGQQVRSYDFGEKASARVEAWSNFEMPEKQVGHYNAYDSATAIFDP